MENASLRVGSDCPVTVSTVPNMGLLISESVCADEEEDSHLEGISSTGEGTSTGLLSVRVGFFGIEQFNMSSIFSEVLTGVKGLPGMTAEKALLSGGSIQGETNQRLMHILQDFGAGYISDSNDYIEI